MCTNHANTCLHSFCNIKPHDAIWSKCTPFQTHPNPSKLSSQVAWRSWTSGRPLRKRSATKIEQPQLQAKLQIGSTMTRTWKSNLVELRSQPVPSAWTKDPYWSSSLCVKGLHSGKSHIQDHPGIRQDTNPVYILYQNDQSIRDPLLGFIRRSRLVDEPKSP